MNTKNHLTESAIFTTNDFKDSELLLAFIEDVENLVDIISADDAYDIYQYLDDIIIVLLIPSIKDARLTRYDVCR